jgi:hypothetical protein
VAWIADATTTASIVEANRAAPSSAPATRPVSSSAAVTSPTDLITRLTLAPSRIKRGGGGVSVRRRDLSRTGTGPQQSSPDAACARERCSGSGSATSTSRRQQVHIEQ